MEAQALYAVSLKHIANDNAPITIDQRIEFLWDAILSTYTQRIEAI